MAGDTDMSFLYKMIEGGSGSDDDEQEEGEGEEEEEAEEEEERNGGGDSGSGSYDDVPVGHAPVIEEEEDASSSDQEASDEEVEESVFEGYNGGEAPERISLSSFFRPETVDWTDRF